MALIYNIVDLLENTYYRTVYQNQLAAGDHHSRTIILVGRDERRKIRKKESSCKLVSSEMAYKVVFLICCLCSAVDLETTDPWVLGATGKAKFLKLTQQVKAAKRPK